MPDNRIIVLLNDNDAVFERVSKIKFEKEAGWETIITSSFAEALKAAEERMPKVVITDIIIRDPGGKTGFDLIDMLNKLDKENKTIIAVLTDLAQQEDKDKAKNLGADYYYVKSDISLMDLITELKKIVQN